jgi:alkylation response protein AidB-like acyl-CoA dehydrogenase
VQPSSPPQALQQHYHYHHHCHYITIIEIDIMITTYQIKRLGPEAMLCKVQATQTFEHCARDAAHLWGGDSYVKGNRIESLYRHVLSLSIPGGSGRCSVTLSFLLFSSRAPYTIY